MRVALVSYLRIRFDVKLAIKLLIVTDNFRGWLRDPCHLDTPTLTIVLTFAPVILMVISGLKRGLDSYP